MKKILLSFFLLISLSFTTLTSNYNKFDVDYYTNLANIKQHEYVVSDIADLIMKKDSIAYLYMDSIPIRSPIAIKQLKNLSSDYGMRKHPIYKRWLWHNGIDLSAKIGTPVYATADGTIININKSRFGYGNLIEIKHTNEFRTKYTHLHKITTKVGDKIKHGQIIGTVGSTGLSTGPHLHYEIIRNNRSIDPLYFSYINKKDRSIFNYYLLLNDLNET